MHIKIVVNSFPSYSETFLFNMVVGLQSKGHRVSVCSMAPSLHYDLYKSRMNEWSGEIDVIPFSKNKIQMIFIVLRILLFNKLNLISKIKMYGFKSALLKTIYEFYLQKNNPDIIHFAYSGIGIKFLEVIPLIKNSSAKVYVSCRGSAEKVKPIVESKRAEDLRELFSLCDRVHCVSKDMLVGLNKYGLDPSKTFINFPSVNTNYFKREATYNAIANSKTKIVTTGRLHFQKGYVYALHAMKILKDEGLDFEYSIIGSGPDLELIKYLINELNLESNVHLLGKISSEEVKRVLNDSDIFLLPSLYEGIANAALEAMALDLPIISTNSGGMEEVIVNGLNGIIVKRFDSIGIANALKILIEKTDLRKQISGESRKVILEKFNIDRQLEIFEKEYSQINNINHEKF
jgi:colanic acid/amylovoran biosynthesis glycosyltransferase